jgi:uncharacterized LabA/DUF88 family protein
MEDQTNSNVNEQGAKNTEEKQTLEKGEFAFEINATFKLDSNGPVIKVVNDGTMSITFNYDLTDKTQLQTDIGDIKFKKAAVFIENTKVKFDDISSFSEFLIDLQGTLDKIFLISKDTTLRLTTEAVKGRQGDAFALSSEKV